MRRNNARRLEARIIALKKRVARDPRVLGVFLFGSQADGYATSRSDIDLAVLFDHDLSLEQELTFEVATSQALGTDSVDVLNLNRANLLLRFRAISGQLIYERDEERVADFIEQTLIEHRDFEPRAQAALRDYIATL
jgi:predicted nucleotidyltransferase